MSITSKLPNDKGSGSFFFCIQKLPDKQEKRGKKTIDTPSLDFMTRQNKTKINVFVFFNVGIL